MFKNYKITITLKTNIVPGKYFLHLDSLVYWYLKDFIQHEKDILVQIDRIIKKTDDIYHASIMMWNSKVKKVNNNITTNIQNFAASLAEIGAIDTLPIEAQFYENKMANITTLNVKEVVFFSSCNKELLKTVLENIAGLGKLTNSGYGQIEKIIFEEVYEDLSIINNGRLVRAIKFSPEFDNNVINSLGAELVHDSRYTVPYHYGKKTTVIMPRNCHLKTGQVNHV